MPIAIVSIVDEDRVWFKSRFGLDDVQEISRDPGLCASAIWASGVYVVESAHTDPRTLANPLVAGTFGLRFYVAAPLQTHDGYRLGTLCLLDRRARRFSSEEQIVLESLAAIVMDQMELRLRAIRTVSTERALRREATQLAKANEGLYQREFRVASALQRTMLPRTFPSINDVQFDAVYVPAGSESVVGGDWYDAFLIDERHLLLTIGDVAGHGITAAALMGLLRQSLRAFALTERSPAALLRLLDAVVRREHDEIMVTAFVAIADLRTKTLHYAAAGHPPPLLRVLNDGVRELGGTGLPLGLRSENEPRDAKLALLPNTLLLLYTDGLTESTRDLLQGEQRLKAALARPTFSWSGKPAHALCEELLPDGNGGDDVAIMSVLFE